MSDFEFIIHLYSDQAAHHNAHGAILAINQSREALDWELKSIIFPFSITRVYDRVYLSDVGNHNYFLKLLSETRVEPNPK